MTITTFDRANLQALRPEIDAALAAVAQKHGIELRLGNISFDPTGTSFTSKIEGKAGAFGETKRKEAIEYAKIFCGVDASAPCEFPNPTVQGAVLVEYRGGRSSRPWVYEKGGKQYITTDANMKLMWPKVVEEAPNLA